METFYSIQKTDPFTAKNANPISLISFKDNYIWSNASSATASILENT
jgi:hypothetical protein